MKGFLSLIAMAVVYLSTAIAAMAQPDCFISSPNGITDVHILTMDGKAYYQVEHHCEPFVSTSRLGMKTNIGDFSQLEFVSVEQEQIERAGKYLEAAGAQELFFVSSVTGEGVDQLVEHLQIL